MANKPGNLKSHYLCRRIAFYQYSITVLSTVHWLKNLGTSSTCPTAQFQTRLNIRFNFDANLRITNYNKTFSDALNALLAFSHIVLSLCK